MGIETNFGKYLGKWILYLLYQLLSFDKEEVNFFTNELLILLRLD